MSADARDAAHGFALAGPVVECAPVAGGHIHATFVVDCATERYILQRLNEHVFPDLDALAANHARVITHVSSHGLRTPTVTPARDGRAWYRAPGGAAWRAFAYLDGTVARETVATADDAFEAARAFGEFDAVVAGLDPHALTETIPHFHDLAWRRAALDASVARDPRGRAAAVDREIATARILARRVMELLEPCLAALPRRVVHNDAKIANVRFDSGTGRAECVIDLDTVMPGTVLHDVGELVRTATTHAPEDAQALDRVDFDLELLNAIAAGYCAGARGSLAGAEIGALAVAGPWLATENGVRFLTDHLDGDTYFRIERDGQNLDRCRTQFRLVELMLEHLDDARRAFARAGRS